MTIRIAFIAAAMFVLAAAQVSAQGRPRQQVVLSAAVMKSMVAHKPKSKTPFTARVGMIRGESVGGAKAVKAGVTSVREIRPRR